MRTEIEGEYSRNFHSTLPFSIDSNQFCSSSGGNNDFSTNRNEDGHSTLG
jgi:hypothetical protein